MESSEDYRQETPYKTADRVGMATGLIVTGVVIAKSVGYESLPVDIVGDVTALVFIGSMATKFVMRRMHQ